MGWESCRASWAKFHFRTQQASEAGAHGLLCLSWSILLREPAAAAPLTWHPCHDALQLQYCSGGSVQGAPSVSIDP